MKAALVLIILGLAAGSYGVSLFSQAGPCTVHLGLAGFGLISAGGACGLGGIIAVVKALRGPDDEDHGPGNSPSQQAGRCRRAPGRAPE